MSKEEYAVEVENISKIYTLRNKNNQYKTDKKEFYALKDVSFKVKKGDVVEILDLYDLALQGIKITDDESTNRWYLEETIKKKEEQVNE